MRFAMRLKSFYFIQEQIGMLKKQQNMKAEYPFRICGTLGKSALPPCKKRLLAVSAKPARSALFA